MKAEAPRKILIIKLGAMGDVLRTTPLARAYKRLYPRVQITWLVAGNCRAVLENNAFIDRLWIWDDTTMERLSMESFDVALNLDKEKEALDAIAKASARSKRGFGHDRAKTALRALNSASSYALRLGVDDELKFKLNQKTYQEISFEQAELPYAKEKYVFAVTPQERQWAKKHLKSLGFDPQDDRPLVGINTGSGGRFAGKKLPPARIVELAQRLSGDLGCGVLLLGGPDEHDLNVELERMAASCAKNAGTRHTIHEFAALVSHLALVVTGDTIAMHIAIACGVPALVFFGSTCHQEIELYGRGDKIVTPVSCAPCYKKDCPFGEKCMQELDLAALLEKAGALLKAGEVRT